MRASIAALLLFVAVAAATSMSGLHVVGNNLVNGAGQGVLLHVRSPFDPIALVQLCARFHAFRKL